MPDVPAQMLKRRRRLYLRIVAATVAIAALSYGGFHLLPAAYYIRELRSNDLVRVEKAVKRLWWKRVPLATPALISVMRNTSSDDHLALARKATYALCKIGTPEAVRAVIEEIERDSPVADSAARALVGATNRQSVHLMLAAVRSEKAELRRAAAMPLSLQDRQECIPGVVEMLEYCVERMDDPELQRLANVPGGDTESRDRARDDIGEAERISDYCARTLRRLTGESFGYKASKSREDRQEAVENWRKWVQETNGNLQAPGPAKILKE